VDEHNVSNQAYGMSDVGLLKADAFSIHVENQTGVLPTPLELQYDGPLIGRRHISAVDSMASRLAIWKAIREQAGVQLYIDSRMALNTMDIHIVRPQVKADRI
jgi:hypothetical protein